MSAEREMPQAGVEQQIAIAPTDVPDVAAIEGLDMGLVDQRHAIGERLDPIPAFRADELRRAHAAEVRTGRRICPASMASAMRKALRRLAWSALPVPAISKAVP